MKTGRTRLKETPPPAEEPQPVKVAQTPKPGPPAAAPQARKKFSPIIILLALFVVFACVMILVTILGGGADEWVKATRTDGAWTTTVTLFGPQVTPEERWESDCVNDPNCTVRAGTCVLKNTNAFQEQVVDEYDEFAYAIYYDETWQQLYEAKGTEFTATQLGSDTWWKDDLHYVLKEELDQDSCQYTSYTLWVNDPNNSAQQIEVYLSECEVWDHVTVYQKVYEQKNWCRCDVTTLVQVLQDTQQGSGRDVLWTQVTYVPQGGKMEQSFSGQVTFLGEDYTFTVSTTNLDEYQAYLTQPYWIGLKDGKPVTISNTKPKD